jgi:hypothetical protein
MAQEIFLAAWSLAHSDADFGPDMAEPRGSAFADHENAMAVCQKEAEENATECELSPIVRWDTRTSGPNGWWATGYDEEDEVVAWVAVRRSELF